LEQQAAGYIDRYLGAKGKGRTKLRSEGVILASEVHRAGVDLCMSRATEFSPRIKVLFRLAAKVALLAHGSGSPELARFEFSLRSDPDGLAEYERSRDGNEG
jgi:hypothetical protein